MPLPDLFSRRRRQAGQSGVADVYQYVDIPTKLRQQLLFAFEDMFVSVRVSAERQGGIWDAIAHFMRREKGVPALSTNMYNGDKREVTSWFLVEPDIDYVLDVVELFARGLSNLSQYREDEYNNGISDINDRFLEAGVGYQVNGGQVIQISNQLVHKEVIVPALELLAEMRYAGANEEFRKAHQEFRAGEYEDCLVDCLKAFESVLKVISADKKWGTAENANAKQLIQAAYDNNLVPTYTQSEFTGLRSILEGGTPTVRNKAGGHGQGVTPRKIPRHLAAFQLHQTAAAILYFAESAK